MECIAYTEHVGVNRQAEGRIGDKKRLYKRIGAISKILTSHLAKCVLRPNEPDLSPGPVLPSRWMALQ